ncbi:ATP-binding cassette domain-containing protein [Corynebacterium breve]|uniref:ATP-binding cassette domain-containing protein n=1 Tax=Corynebacterium breve TaxID=3049799 RepID=A0ABY8VEP0_9CORY|nr:ATP-binding cassette domain-containing protein [Corynebacterium breve]WIM68115.1 ATP-binding cassette domain-containing protein [Corynebacterium breve]
MSLVAENLSFSYADNDLIRNVHLELQRGEIIGLHGFSGSGKTTLAKLLAGYLRPDQGRVLVDDQPLPRNAYRPVQLVQQHPERAIDPHWRLAQVVKNIAPETLQRMGVREEWLQRFPLEVSGGQLQRVNISRALDPRTEYLVADEITTMMDGLLQADIWRGLVDEVRARNLGMMVISHDHDLLRHVCEAVLPFEELAS